MGNIVIDRARIKTLRGAMKEGIMEMANLCEIDHATLSRIESGLISNPRVETVYKIALHLGVRIEELLIIKSSFKI